jgi:predicted PolB exonuclease-like 3'-5' exonuclease
VTPVLAFDIETIPDLAGLRVLYDFPPETQDHEVAEMAMLMRRQKTGSDFLQLHLQRVVTIACVLRSDEGLRVFSLAEPDSDEAGIVQRFFDGIGKYTPQLVSWNGGGFDLPVLHYRALKHGATAPRYWDLGEDDKEFKWNNYLSRYHARHLDLMDLLALYQPRGSAPLDQMAKLCGFPGKLGMDGSQVWGAYERGEMASIRDYCETDAMNTYLMYLRFQKLRGHLNAAAFDAEIARTREALGKIDAPHWREFLAAWA